MTYTQARPTRSAGAREPGLSDRDASNIRDLLQVIRSEIVEEAPVAAPHPEPDETRDFDFSYDMLHKIANFIELLQQRCRTLEADKRHLVEASRADLEAATETAAHWQEAGSALKAKLDECARQLGDAKLRAETAEKRTDALVKHIQATEQRAVAAEGLAKNYHDRILASFGNASRLQSMLRDMDDDR